MRVHKIHFNHDPTSAQHDAMNIENDGGADLTEAEWSAGFARRPVAYAASAITPPVTIKVTFADGPPGMAVDIRAIAGGSLDNHAPPQLAPLGIHKPRLVGTRSPLGAVLMQSVKFDANGDSQPVLFQLSGRLHKAKVGTWAFMWTWQTRIAASRWRKFATTAHLAHIAPALPNPPWTQDPADAPWTLPRADALDKACMWAAGTKFPDHSAAAIAVAINNIPHQEYGLEATLITMDWEFRLTHYLTQVDGAAPFTVNCKDISSALMTFANLLGANLWPLSIGSGFWSNNVSALNDPNFIAHEWGNHEVAAKESTFPQAFAADLVLTPPGEDEPVQIYDACLKLNGDNVPPMDMLFGSVGSGAGYRFRLIDSRTGNGIPSKPKARRPVL